MGNIEHVQVKCCVATDDKKKRGKENRHGKNGGKPEHAMKTNEIIREMGRVKKAEKNVAIIIKFHAVIRLLRKYSASFKRLPTFLPQITKFGRFDFLGA